MPNPAVPSRVFVADPDRHFRFIDKLRICFKLFLQACDGNASHIFRPGECGIDLPVFDQIIGRRVSIIKRVRLFIIMVKFSFIRFIDTNRSFQEISQRRLAILQRGLIVRRQLRQIDRGHRQFRTDQPGDVIIFRAAP